MWGKIGAAVLALVIGIGAAVDVAAQTTRPAKVAKVQKAGVTRTAHPVPSVRPKRAVKDGGKPAATRHAPRPARKVAARPGSPRPKAGQMRSAGRTVRPSPRGPSRSVAPGRGAAAPKAWAVQGQRGKTRYGRPPAFGMPPSAGRQVPKSTGGARTLSFYNAHTGQALTATYFRNGRYVPSELNRLNAFLRDWRDGDRVRMDPALFDILWQVRYRLRTNAPYHVLSAYRSPETNAWLASVSSGVASDSYHMRGQAMDVMLPGRSPHQIRQAARALRRGGVGYYPSSGFVHIDTGPVRYW